MAETTKEKYLATVKRKLQEQTGKTVEQWAEVVRQQPGVEKYMAKVNWLKQEHGLGHSAAMLLVEQAEKGQDFWQAPKEETLAAQYAGKESLRPIYDRVVAAATSLGDDVQLEYCKTYVAFVRSKQFALVKPSTKSRVDLGLVLPGMEATERLAAAGSFGSGRTTHKVGLTSPEDVDQALVDWLRAAYQQA